jgi:NTP pyrophosphatase (non-canonical NTP hydrolase)
LFNQSGICEITETDGSLNIDMNKVTVLIEDWATARDLDVADPNKQMLKLMEEVGELAQGLAKNNREQVIDSIGDVYVVLTILSMQLELNLKECIHKAYEEIKDRKGKMINGVYVKESDLK